MCVDPAVNPLGPSLSDADEELLHGVRELAGRLGNDEVIARDSAGRFPSEAWRELAAAGLTGLPIPTEFGGRGASAVATVAALTTLGGVCTDNGLMFALGAHLWACAEPIASFGTPEQKKQWLPGLCDGSFIGAHAATEPAAGSDAGAISTTAVRTSTGWTLNGHKTFITNGPIADIFLVTAVTDPSHGSMGISAFLVPRSASGLSIGEPIDKSGLRAAQMGEITLANCQLEADAVLGTPGAGMAIFTAAMTRERTFILAPTIGVMERLADECCRYASQRQQFGTPIGEFQSVSNRLADMRLRAYTARLLIERVAELTDRRQARMHDAAMVKLHLSESFLATAMDAVHIHGGRGYTTAMEFERMVRDAMGSRIYSGTSDIQRNLISRAGMRAARKHASL